MLTYETYVGVCWCTGHNAPVVYAKIAVKSVWPHSPVSGPSWGNMRGPSAPCKRLLLVLTSPHCHIKTDAYSVFYRTSICSNYSKAMLPHITYVLLKIFKFKLLLFLLYIPPNFLFYYRKPALYSPL